MHYISHSGFAGLLDKLQEQHEVYVPVKRGGQRFYQKYGSAGNDLVAGEVRAFEPLKAFFFRSREVVAEGFDAEVPGSGRKPYCIVGVKACDLKGFTVQDHVFKDHDYEDPFYTTAREKNLIIAADCTCAIDTCFCTALDVKPYPQRGFDFNIGAVNGGYVVEVGSEKGQEIFEAHASLFDLATSEIIEQRDEQRARVEQEVEKNLADNGIPRQDQLEGAIQRNYEAQLWDDEAQTCVECGACNTICPTCHCFFLYDQKDETRMQRFRTWDSCMIKDFAGVAGGANPRPELWMRLRNRFEKKFDYFPKVAEIYACTGCGRCISACPGKIDIRRVLKRLTADG